VLESLDGTTIQRVAREQSFRALERQLGDTRSDEVRDEFNRIIDDMEPNNETGLRTFSSSHLGSSLSPWRHPLSHLYDVAWEIEGENSTDDHVEHQAALFFGLFIWECVMNREERWVFYDPNLSPNDPNREITGKVYFERENHS
jgi:hypothetical protein